MFKIETQHRIAWVEILYIIIVILGSYLVYISEVHL
jgi:hypothetical protein